MSQHRSSLSRLRPTPYCLYMLDETTQCKNKTRSSNGYCHHHHNTLGGRAAGITLVDERTGDLVKVPINVRGAQISESAHPNGHQNTPECVWYLDRCLHHRTDGSPPPKRERWEITDEIKCIRDAILGVSVLLPDGYEASEHLQNAEHSLRAASRTIRDRGIVSKRQ